MRILERFLSLLLALALLLGAVLLALEVVWAVAGRPPLLVPWDGAYTSGTQDAWGTAAVRLIAGLLVLAGVLLLLVVLKPRRPSRMPMTSTAVGIDAAITRRSLSHVVRTAATRVDGVSSAKAKVGKRRVTVSATSRLGSRTTASDLQGPLEAAVQERLTSLQLARPPRLRARVSPRSGASS